MITGISDELLMAILKLLKKYLMDDSVKIIDMTSQALRVSDRRNYIVLCTMFASPPPTPSLNVLDTWSVIWLYNTKFIKKRDNQKIFFFFGVGGGGGEFLTYYLEGLW